MGWFYRNNVASDKTAAKINALLARYPELGRTSGTRQSRESSTDPKAVRPALPTSR